MKASRISIRSAISPVLCLMFLLGFIPTLIACKIMDGMGLLRVPEKVELEGVDFALNQAFMASVREVGKAEKAMIK